MHDSAWSDLDQLIDEAMACWGVPGLAVSVVRGDEVIYLKGHGTRDLGEDVIFLRGYGTSDPRARAPVTTNTQFMICSLTKSINAAGLALLVDEGRLGWDTKVREILPEFRLRDAIATEEITVADLLTHRSGLPAHDRVWSPPGPRSRQDMLEAMRYLEPRKGFRECHQYSNLGYVVAGMIAERLSGQRWEEYTTQRLLLPLGFTNFGFSKAALESAADHAYPHERERHSVLRGKLWPMQATPAGGINACAADMGRWVRFLLSGGRVDGRQLLTRAAIDAMMAPHTEAGESEFAEIGKMHYGYGLRREHYRGHATVGHTGSQPGWGAYMTMMPEHRIGVVVLTNREPSPVCGLIAYAVYDRLLSLEPLNWFDIFRERRRAVLQQEEAEEIARATAKPAIPLISESQDDISGEYRHPAYGCISIIRRAAETHWNWRGLSGILTYLGPNSYQLKEHGAIPRYPSGLFASLEMNEKGRIVALKSPLEPAISDIVFQRDAGLVLQ